MARPVTTLNRWEKVSNQAWATNGIVRLRKNVELDPSRVVRAISINVQGTATVSGGPATGLLGDNVGAILEQIRAYGNHLKRGTTDNFIQVRGCDLKELVNEYAGVSVFDNSAALAVGNGAYALDFTIILEFPPPNLRVEEQVGYLLDVPNWAQLEIDLQFADEKNLWNLGGAAVAWSAQTVNVCARYAQEKGKFAGFGFGLRYLIFQENNSAQLTTTGNQQNLYQLDNKGRIRSLLLKTGVKATTMTAGNNAFASLSDSILSNVRIIQVPNQKFREFNRFVDIKAIQANEYHFNPAKGYALIDTSFDGLSFEAIRPSSVSTGEARDTNFWLQSDVVGAANQALVSVQESLYYTNNIVIPTS